MILGFESYFIILKDLCLLLKFYLQLKSKNYIKEIHIMLDVIEDNEAYLQEAEKLSDYEPSLIKFYYKEKETTFANTTLRMTLYEIE